MFRENEKTAIVIHSPGRINLIGEHTDYNEGFVLPAAIDKKIELRIQANNNPSLCHLYAANMDEDYTFDLKGFGPLKGGWQNYLLGVVHEMQKKGAQLKGFDCEFGGNIPIGGGVSSSAALECSIAFGLNELFKLGFSRMELIKMAQMAEHNFVGTKCGIMDQFASMMGKKNQAILLDCRSLEHTFFSVELGEYELLLINTNVFHNLATSAYNTRREACETGVDILKKAYPEMSSLRDATLPQLEHQKANISDNIYKRCFHVITENERVLDATKALDAGDLVALGQYMYQSHISLRDHYEVSCPELDFLVAATIDKDYILGSRMMGGGFGGCTLNIIEQSKKEDFLKNLIPAYQAQFGIEPTPITVTLEDGTSRVAMDWEDSHDWKTESTTSS